MTIEEPASHDVPTAASTGSTPTTRLSTVGLAATNPPTCVDVHFYDGTVRHMTLPEFFLYCTENGITKYRP